ALAQYDTRLKVNPPLREESDRAALIAALIDGTIDAICSDHCPCTSTEKDCEFDLAPFGAATLETAFSAAYDALVATGHLDVKLLITRLTTGPAKVLGIEAGTLSVGAAADFVLINPKTSWTFNTENQLSKSGNNPLIGKTFSSRIHSTFVGGKAVILDSKPV
ncbi:MAG: dihydroorotase, partial [Verrucomicrobia bacterium]|nr:dihydroorotase [Verrucomicrobiota bacterium]